MRFPQIDRAESFLVVTAPIVLKTSFPLGGFEWPKFIGLAILLPAAMIALGALLLHLRREDHAVERRVPGEKISNSLVVLSSAAILAVYTAGYVRTRSAEDRFAERSAQRKAVPSIATSALPPTVAPPEIATPLTVKRSTTPTSSSATRSIKSSTARTGPVGVTVPPQADGTLAPSPGAPVDSVSHGKYVDGTYLGWGMSRHGDIQASVTVQDGKFSSAAIVKCLTRYSCSWIEDLPGQVVSRQSGSVDYVSGATESSEAFMDAIADALSKAN